MFRYTADEEHGTVMEVTYEGEAHHPGLQPPPPARPRPQLSPGRTAQRMEFVESRRRSRGEEEDPLLGILAEISELTSLRFPRSHQSEEEEPDPDTSLLTTAAPGVAEVDSEQMLGTDTSTSRSRPSPRLRSGRGGLPPRRSSPFASTKIVPFLHESVQPRQIRRKKRKGSFLRKYDSTRNDNDHHQGAENISVKMTNDEMAQASQKSFSSINDKITLRNQRISSRREFFKEDGSIPTKRKGRGFNQLSQRIRRRRGRVRLPRSTPTPPTSHTHTITVDEPLRSHTYFKPS